MIAEAVIVRARTEREIQAAIVRLTDAGLNEAAAAKVARHPTWGPVVLAPGVIVSLFDMPSTSPAEAAS